MKTPERHFYLEYFLTFLLFLPAWFLFSQEEIFLRFLFACAILLGAIVSYFSRDQFHSIRKFITLAASLLIFAGTVYGVLKSTYLYQEVIIICIRSLSLLIVVNSFSLRLKGCLSSIQIFSILLFFCISALAKGASSLWLILTAGFVFNFVAIVRIKFYTIFNPLLKATTRRQGINLLFVSVLTMAALLAGVLFRYVPFGIIKTWGYLKQDSLSPRESQQEERFASLPDEQIQSELTRLAFKLSSTEAMHQVIAAVQDLLIKEEPLADEVDNAKKYILSTVNNPSLALEAEKARELNDSIKRYVNTKVLKNLIQIKSRMDKIIEKNRIGLRKRFAILSLVNRIESSNSIEEIGKDQEQLRTVFNDALITEEARKQLKQLNRQLKEWKIYQVYIEKFDLFQDKISALDKNKKQDFKELAEQIDQASEISASNLVDARIEKMRRVSFLEDDKLIDQAEELLKLKKIMLALKESSQLRKKIEDSGQSVDSPPELVDALDAGQESRDAQYLGAQSLPPVNVEVIREKYGLLKLIAKAMFFIFLALIIIFAYFYILTQKAKERILILYPSPREFIIALYRNLNQIMAIFGMPQKSYMPPLFFAGRVDEKYAIKDDLFLRFAQRYAEAKYSLHIFSPEISSLALEAYNQILNIIFAQHNKRTLGSRYFKAVVSKVPFVINKIQPG
jgi:hypothetical protein